MSALREKLKNPAYWLSLLLIAFMVFMLAKCTVETASLLVNPDYAIAHITKVYRGGKMEHLISYYYVVNNKLYTSGAERSGPFKIGARYVIRYGRFAPSGNKFLGDVPVPDSVRQDTGRVWQAFLAHHNL